MGKQRTCISCGKKYDYCPNCGNFSKYPKWMTEFCSEECKEVFNIISGYNIGVKSDDDVKKVISKYNVNDYSKFSGSIQNTLNSISKSSVIKEEIPVVKEAPVIEEKVVVEEEAVVEEAPVEIEVNNEEERPSYNRKRRRKNMDVD